MAESWEEIELELEVTVSMCDIVLSPELWALREVVAANTHKRSEVEPALQKNTGDQPVQI
jgi:hypothetical protein